MWHLIKYRFLQITRNRPMMFWALAFPMILGTLFYISFGNIGISATGDSDWDPVPVAVINKLETKSSGTFFADFLDAMNGSVLDIQDVKNEKDAKKKLENDEIFGIYYVKEAPSLTITKNGVSQSILTSLLNTYNQNAYLFKEIARTHPERLTDAVASLQTNGSFITEKSVGGKTLNPTVLYFFALIAYACMSGAYLSIEAVRDTQANLSPLGARRSITPYRKQFLIFIDMLVLIFIHFINVMILTFYVNYILDIDLGNNYLAILATNFMGSLIGICLGLMIGCIGKLTFSAKIGICTSTTLLTGFLSGLMFGNMKDVIETIQTQYEALSRHGEQSMRIEESIVFLKITAILYGKYVDNSDKLKLKSKLDKALTLQKEKQKLHLEQLSMSEEDRVIKVVCELVDDKDLYRRCSYKDKALYRGEANEMLVSNRGVFLSRKALVYGLKRYNCTGISVKKIILALSQMELLDEDRGGTHTTKIQNVRAYCILYNELKERYEELRGTEE